MVYIFGHCGRVHRTVEKGNLKLWRHIRQHGGFTVDRDIIGGFDTRAFA
jgi:hypothetical protein